MDDRAADRAQCLSSLLFLELVDALKGEAEDRAPELRNFFNLREGLGFLRVWMTATDPIEKTIAKATFMNFWGGPLVTVLVLETFWHFVFKWLDW